MTAILALFPVWNSSQIALAQSESPGDIFWDGFETGDLLHWEGVQIPGGGSIEFPPGSLAPGTQVVVQPVATPGLPADVEALGQAYDIAVTPQPLEPAILTLPLPLGEDSSDIWIVGVRDDESVIVYGTEVSSNARPFRTDEGGPTSDEFFRAMILFELTGLQEAHALARIDPSSLRPRIVSSQSVPFRQRVRDPVTASVEWSGEATEVDFKWSDAQVDTNPVDSSTVETSQEHFYEDIGKKTVRFDVVNETPNPDQKSSGFAKNEIWVGIEGVWLSTSGTITFEPISGDMIRGTYNPSQNGVITGEISGDGHVLFGNWVETLSNANCESEMPDSEGNPSIHWGTLRFVFDEDFTFFCGEWSHCDNELTGVWRGWAPGSASPTCP